MRYARIALAPLTAGLAALATLGTAPLAAQAAPATAAPAPAPTAPVTPPPDPDLWVADLVRSRAADGSERWSIERPRNVTRREGYDNQPYFLSDGQRLLFSSTRGAQNDIFELDLATGRERQRTATETSEFSPQPSSDGTRLLVVRVEPDGTQRLWSFPSDGGAEPTVVAPEVKGVGYQAWLDAGTVAVFVLGEPFTLQLVDLASGTPKTIAASIGRSIHKVPGRRAVSFTAPDPSSAGAAGGAGARAIFVFDAASGATARVAPAPTTVEGDYAWTPDGVLLSGDGSTLFRLRPGVDDAWQPIADLAGDGVGKITRLAVDPMGVKLAFVAE